jgi:hypothetical protein
MLIGFDLSIKLMTMLGLVLNLVSVLKNHVLDLLNGSFERTQCDFGFLVLSECFQFLVGLLVFHLLKLRCKGELVLSEAL